MKRQFPIVYAAGAANEADLTASLDAVDLYEEEYESARRDLKLEGRLERAAARLPGIVDYRFAQLQDIEAILEHLEGRYKKAWVEKTKHFLEHYQRTLSDRVAREYAEVSDDVMLIKNVINRVANVRNLYLGLHEGIKCLQFQISNVTKLKAEGIEDAEISNYYN